MTDIANPLSSLRHSLDAMQTSRDRLRRVAAAIASGQFDGLSHPVDTSSAAAGISARLEGRANALDAAYEQMQRRVMEDISGAMQRMDAVASFSAAATRAVTPIRGQETVIDVQAKEVQPPPATAP
jgi:DNA-binding NtrC family response regulator